MSPCPSANVSKGGREPSSFFRLTRKEEKSERTAAAPLSWHPRIKSFKITGGTNNARVGKAKLTPGTRGLRRCRKVTCQFIHSFQDAATKISLTLTTRSMPMPPLPPPPPTPPFPPLLDNPQVYLPMYPRHVSSGAASAASSHLLSHYYTQPCKCDLGRQIRSGIHRSFLTLEPD